MTQVGDRVRLQRCTDPHTRLEPGEEGTVTFIDALGTVSVDWDSGSKLGLIRGEDSWIVLKSQTVTKEDVRQVFEDVREAVRDSQESENDPRARLEYLRGELRAERISYGELAELQGLVEFIDPGDVELLEAAGVPEFPEDEIEVNRFSLNDHLSALLADYGWHDDGSDEEGERLNELTHSVGDLLDDFLNQKGEIDEARDRGPS